MQKLLVTGGLGFMGSYFVNMALEEGYSVVNLDKKTYAHRKDVDFSSDPNYQFLEADICTIEHLPPEIDVIVNFAAESHVDNSILANEAFFESNTRGVYNLLELIRAKDPTDQPVLLHISTDEVYGPTIDGSFREDVRLHPSSPYSATKAAGDNLIIAWGKTYGTKYKICRPCNNYGFGQYPEKLFAKTVDYIARGRKMTVHGNGSYLREWMYAEDCCRGILTVLQQGELGEIYNISTNEEHTVLEVVHMIAEAMGKNPQEWIDFVENRPGQDGRYSVDCTKIRSLGWEPTMHLKDYIPTYLNLYGATHGFPELQEDHSSGIGHGERLIADAATQS